MLYNVTLGKWDDKVGFKRTLFRSAVIDECREFIRLRKASGNHVIAQEAKKLHIENAFGEIVKEKSAPMKKAVDTAYIQ